MPLKEQLSKIVEVAKLTEEAAHTVSEDIRLGPLANTIVDCPDLLNQIKALLVGEDTLAQPMPVISNTGYLDLDELRKHAEKLEKAARVLHQRTTMVREGHLFPEDLLEPVDAIHKIAALLPKAGPEVAVVNRILVTNKVEAGSSYQAVADELSRVGFKKFGESPSHRLTAAPGYEQLVQVFAAAHDQAAYGKGKERHANGLPFHEQRMQGISDLVGSPDGMVYQLMKKTTEGLQFDSPEKREHELLGALNYLAGIVIWLRRHEAAKPVEV